jgi:hypothetical protein
MHQRHFGCLASCSQSLIEGFDHGIVACRDLSSHIPGAPHDGASTPNHAAAAQASTVPVERRHADQDSDLRMRQRAQLRQLRQVYPTDHGPDARHGAQQILMLAPARRRLDPVSQVLVQRHERLLQLHQMRCYLPLNRTRCRPHAMLFRHEHFDQLSSPREPRTERLRRRIGHGTWGRPHRFGKAG